MIKMMKDAMILFSITLIAGFLLGCVYQITKEPILKAEEKAANDAYAEVFPLADHFEEMEVNRRILTQASDADQESEGFDGVQIDAVLRALDQSGSELGYVMQMTSHEGYGGDITFTMGVDQGGTCNGISLLKINETPGLGMNAEKVLVPQLAGKNVEVFSLTKGGAAVDSQVDTISGATITSDALVTAVNAGLYYFQTELRMDH